MSPANRWPFVPPMKAEPADHPPRGDDWLAELKWDGMRLQVHRRDGAVRLLSATGRDRTGAFPELAGLADAVATDAILDGEAVVFTDGRPDFGRLQHRMHVDTPTGELVATHPVVFVAFDLLHLDGHDLTPVALDDRRRLLEQVLDDGPSWRVPPAADDPAPLLTLAEERALEGIVVKRRDSRYRPGERSPHWRKIKIRRHQEFVVGGWIPSANAPDVIGSLAVGVHDAQGRLVACGSVGSGLDERTRELLTARLRPAECPFQGDLPPYERPPRWVDPTEVVEVAYGEWPDGGTLRHPALLGLRTDQAPADVRRERPAPN